MSRSQIPSDQSRIGFSKRQSLIATCLTHALHDGYADGVYVLLPIWQDQYGLSFAALAILRALYAATMGCLQIPTGRLLGRASARTALTLSTIIAAAGLLLTLAPFGLAALCLGLFVAGIGSSIQHPQGSMLVTATYGDEARGPLGIYNFSGDLGKAVLPASMAMLLQFSTWQQVLGGMAVLGFVVAGALFRRIPKMPANARASRIGGGLDHRGFRTLVVIGALDTATRMGFLLFLPFVVHGKSGGTASVGLALGLLFAGGAFGKATCSWLGERFGTVGTVIATEAATALLILSALYAPLYPMLALLPFLGIVMNGTSSVLYGEVPPLSGGAAEGFAVFYTSVIVSGGIAPVLYGALADHSDRTTGVAASAATALLIVPLVLAIRQHLHRALAETAPAEAALSEGTAR